jgi:hypothetical protein
MKKLFGSEVITSSPYDYMDYNPEDDRHYTHKNVQLIAAARRGLIYRDALTISLVLFGLLLILSVYSELKWHLFSHSSYWMEMIMFIILSSLLPLGFPVIISLGYMMNQRANDKATTEALKISILKERASLQPKAPRKPVPEHWLSDYAWALVTKEIPSETREEARKAGYNDEMWNAARETFTGIGVAFTVSVNNKPSFRMRRGMAASDFWARMPENPPEIARNIPHNTKQAQATTLDAIRESRQ